MEITLVDGIKDGHKYELVLVDGFEFEYAKFGTPEYVDILRKRIAEVRNWVQNLDYEHRISFSIPDP